jgi:hypothetical protein
MSVSSEEDKRASLTPEHEVLREVEGLDGEVEVEIFYDPRPNPQDSPLGDAPALLGAIGWSMLELGFRGSLVRRSKTAPAEKRVPRPKKVVEQTVQKATSRTGSGTKRGGGRRGTGGAITITSVAPSENVSNPVPTVRATVKAKGSNLSKSDVRLYLDGAEQKRFYTTGEAPAT